MGKAVYFEIDKGIYKKMTTNYVYNREQTYVE